MKKLIIVRHGVYNKSAKKLTAEGEAQIKSVASELSGILLGHTAIILSSPAPQAEQSAELLKDDLGIDTLEFDETLQADKTHLCNTPKAFDLIQEQQKKHGASVVIVVTHLQYCNYLPNFAHMQIKKIKKSFPQIEKGGKLIIDFEEQ